MGEYFWIKFKKYDTDHKGIMQVYNRLDYGIEGICLYTDGVYLRYHQYTISYDELIEEAKESDWFFSLSLYKNGENDMLRKSLEGYVDGILFMERGK